MPLRDSFCTPIACPFCQVDDQTDCPHFLGWTSGLERGLSMRESERELRAQIRQVRAEMKAKGIRRISCFNGGHTAESYRLNAEMFRLETLLKTLQGKRVI